MLSRTSAEAIGSSTVSIGLRLCLYSRGFSFELVSTHHFAEKDEAALCADAMCFTNDFIKKLNEKFKVAEIDDNGLVWSLAIKGKRI